MSDDQGGVRDRRILIVDDDLTLLEVASTYLRAAGFLVDTATDAFTGLDALDTRPPDLVILDRMIPGVDGIEVCRRLRLTSSIPVIMLTALGGQEDRIEGLEAGVDDYMAKPFSPRELTLRVQSVLRRSVADNAPEGDLSVGRFQLSQAARTISLDGEHLSLTIREFDLLAYLLKRPGQVFSREHLLGAVWGWTIGDLSTVTVHVRRLREKIEADASAPTLLATVWGVGYRLDAHEPASGGRHDG